MCNRSHEQEGNDRCFAYNREARQGQCGSISHDVQYNRATAILIEMVWLVTIVAKCCLVDRFWSRVGHVACACGPQERQDEGANNAEEESGVEHAVVLELRVRKRG